MGAGVEGIAYDWLNKHVYWTDSEQNWLMVSDINFKYYAPIYTNEKDATPYALAIHSKHRFEMKIVFRICSKLFKLS